MPAGDLPEPTFDDELARLVRLGRDREAAELASGRLARAAQRPPTPRPPTQRPPTQGASMDPRKQLDEILPALTDLVASLDAAQLDATTPCAKFAVRDVLAHMVGGATVFAAAFRGEAAPTPSDPGDLAAAFPVAMNGLLDAVHSPGALERTIAAPFGEVPGDVFASFVAMDGLVHGWDIATAIGRPYAPADALVAEVDAFARQAISDGMRDGDTFAAEVVAPASATPIERLAAFTGRQV